MDTQQQIAILREQAETEVGNHPRMGFEPATEKQYSLVVRVMEEVIPDPELRIKVLAEIFPYGVTKVTSTKHLTKAEASVLIRKLFGLDRDEPVPAQAEITPEAADFLAAVRYQVSTARREQLKARGQQEFEL